MDAGAVGTLVFGYPLQLLPADDPRLVATARFLRRQSFVHGGFFQDMIHSGINAYLTLHVAQVLLRAGEAGWFELAQTVARLASPTGQWPEAIHPQTFGGCMGDGQHVWAAAEWVMFLRNAFVREEADRLVLGAGLPEEWTSQPQAMEFGPAPTPWGEVHVRLEGGPQPVLQWRGHWRREHPPLELRVPGFVPQQVHGAAGEAPLARSAA